MDACVRNLGGDWQWGGAGSGLDSFATASAPRCASAENDLVGGMRDRETVIIALSHGNRPSGLEHAHTINAGETMDRILGMFERRSRSRSASA